MKHTFSFTEIHYGKIAIESSTRPTSEEVEAAIIDQRGGAVDDTLYANISLEKTAPNKARGKREKDWER